MSLDYKGVGGIPVQQPVYQEIASFRDARHLVEVHGEAEVVVVRHGVEARFAHFEFP